MRAWHGRGERRSPEMGVRQDAPTIEPIVWVTFYEIINSIYDKKKGRSSWRPNQTCTKEAMN
jgi:hypothetical protein